MHAPTYDDLPSVDKMPRRCVWGVVDKDGKKDLFGTLNHLTAATIEAAAAEVPDGVFLLRISTTDAFVNPTPEDMAKLAQIKFSGAHGIEATTRWSWDKRFAAVATDSPSRLRLCRQWDGMARLAHLTKSVSNHPKPGVGHDRSQQQCFVSTVSVFLVCRLVSCEIWPC
ncbi:hypothetical protein VDGL01_04396 [Verticillium dahliae]